MSDYHFGIDYDMWLYPPVEWWSPEYDCELPEPIEAANIEGTLLVNAEDAIEQVRRLQSENAKLRELTQDMYGFIRRMDEECGDVTFSDCFDYCKHDTADDGCCKTGECWYERRMQEILDEIGAE